MNAIPEGLIAARDQVRDELRRADTKATTLLSLVGVALAGVGVLVTKAPPVAASVTLWVALAPILWAVLLLLSAIRPRLGGGNPVAGSWLFAATHGPESLLASYGDGEQASATVTAADVCALALIARTKYRRVRSAVDLVAVGVCLLVAALVLSVVAR